MGRGDGCDSPSASIWACERKIRLTPFAGSCAESAPKLDPRCRLALNLDLRRIRALLAAAMVTLASVGACNQPNPAPPPQRWHVVAHLPVGNVTGPVTLGGQWAFVPDMSKGTVTQIDRATGRAVATINIAGPQLLRTQGCAPTGVPRYYFGSWGWARCPNPIP